MRIDIDTYREIVDTLTRNKTRSLLTGFGVFWGVFMLIVLIGGSRGLKEMLEANFSGFATNAAVVWSQPTSKPYMGFRKGRYWNMNVRDIERLRRQVPQLDVILPLVFAGNRTAVKGIQSFVASVQGVEPCYVEVAPPEIRYGRYLNEVDRRAGRKACVIGKQVYQTLFPQGGDPCGEMIRVEDTYYRVVGVDFREGGHVNFSGRPDEIIFIPITVLRRVYNRGDAVDLIAVTAKKGVVMSDITPAIRQTIARAHYISPEDEAGLTVFNTEILYSMLDSLFRGVAFLSWLVGIGTLLAGAVGVSNIMMVTVRERTVEIGIRRAIGATPKAVLSQIISESILLTAVAGMSGILLGVGILQMIELANTSDSILAARFQVDFWTAVFAAFLLCVLGGLAGLAPALRAMSIKPVDAMRDE